MTSAVEVSADAIFAAALKVYTREELAALSEPECRSLCSLIAKRLAKPGPPPAVAELEGIRELVEVHLWHPALNTAAAKGGA